MKMIFFALFTCMLLSLGWIVDPWAANVSNFVKAITGATVWLAGGRLCPGKWRY
jgi:hypothetical protein